MILIIVLLIVVRLLLPPIAMHQINKTLANDIEGYHGSINDLSMSIYKGAFSIGDLVIYEEASEDFIEAYSKEIENAINFGGAGGSI